jgi:hypothetical protein
MPSKWFTADRVAAFRLARHHLIALDAKVRRGMAAEAEALATFLAARCDVAYKAL